MIRPAFLSFSLAGALFLFAIVGLKTETVRFLGRVANPAK
jgi:hypothetical protein